MTYQIATGNKATQIHRAVKRQQIVRAAYWQRMLNAARGVVEAQFIPINQVY